MPLQPRAPSVGVEQARVAERVVTRLLDGPREVRFRDATAVLPVATLASLVTTKPVAGTLRVGLDVDRLRKELLPKLGRFEREPVDARFVVDGNRVRVAADTPGRKLDADRIALSLVTNLPTRAHLARFLTSQPKLTTEKAKKLRITELVSEFTTNYPCCAPRVTNIKRAATLLDGTIILPGKEFSLNGALGKRTDGEGIRLGAADLQRSLRGRCRRRHQPGRDDALQRRILLRDQARRPSGAPVLHLALPDGTRGDRLWGGPELIFRNDWPAAILMKLDASDSGITVRFYSTKLGRRVTTTTGEPYDLTTPKSVTVTNSALPPGSRQVVQEAGDGGFTIDYTRQVFRDG